MIVLTLRFHKWYVFSPHLPPFNGGKDSVGSKSELFTEWVFTLCVAYFCTMYSWYIMSSFKKLIVLIRIKNQSESM